MEYTTLASSILAVVITTALVVYLARKGELFRNW